MNDNLKIALENVLNGESAAYLTGEEHVFSDKFEREMERMISGKRSVRKRGWIRALMIAACAAALFGLSLTAGAAVTKGFTVSNGFNGFWNRPTTAFSATGIENAPKTLEKYYTLGDLPDGVNYVRHPYLNDANTTYQVNFYPRREEIVNDPFSNTHLVTLTQQTKEAYRDTFLTPKFVEVKEITVGGEPGYLITQERVFGTLNIVIFDEGDYILRLWCVMPEDEAIALAESVVVCDDPMSEEVAL